MKFELKQYQTPEILVFPISCDDLLTASDNDTDWDHSWDGIIS